MELHHEDDRTTPRTLLGRRLRRLREAEGLSLRELARRLGFPFGYISRVERGEQLPSDALAETLDSHYSRDDLSFAELLDMARDSAMPHYGKVFLASERKARRIQVFDSSIIPGLLQTPDYARALFRTSHPRWGEAEVTAQIELRLSRRKVFEAGEPPFFWAIVDEAALCRPIGGADGMATQLSYLLEAISSPQITFQVLPFSQAEHTMMGGSLSLLTLHDGVTIGYVESFASGEAAESPDQILQLTQRFDAARAKALPEAESAELICRYLEEYKNGRTAH